MMSQILLQLHLYLAVLLHVSVEQFSTAVQWSKINMIFGWTPSLSESDLMN